LNEGHEGEDLEAPLSCLDEALEIVAPVTSPEGCEALMRHAEGKAARVEDMRQVTRDKAKLLVGTSSFGFAVIVGSVSLIHESLDRLPTWLLLTLLPVLVVAAVHLVRAIMLAVRALIREQDFQVPTQEVVNLLSDASVDKESRQKKLAGHVLSAAAQTTALVRARVNQVILAQTSFFWGVALMGAFTGTHAIAFAFAGPTISASHEQAIEAAKSHASVVDAAVKSLEEEVAQLSLSLQGLSQSFAAASARLSGHLDARIEPLVDMAEAAHQLVGRAEELLPFLHAHQGEQEATSTKNAAGAAERDDLEAAEADELEN